jgi:hypothetical protein
MQEAYHNRNCFYKIVLVGKNAPIGPNERQFDADCLTGKNTNVPFISLFGRSAHQIADSFLASENADKSRPSRSQDEPNRRFLKSEKQEVCFPMVIMRYVFQTKTNFGLGKDSCDVDCVMARSLLAVVDRMRGLLKE